MAGRGSHGFREQPYKEKEESEEGAEVDERRRNGELHLGESNLVGNLDCWTLSSSQEILEDEELLRELKDYQHLLEEGDQGFDLGELQDLERDANTSSLLPEDEGSPKDLGLRSYLQPDVMSDVDSPEPGKSRGAWDFGSQEDVHPELSFEDQYGSDFSPSPEILQDPLTLYKCSFASDNVDQLSESSNLSPSPCGPPPVCTQLETEPQSLPGGDGLDFLKDRKFSLESARSLESQGRSSLAISLQYNQRLLDFQSLEDLQNCPGIDAETCPELSWMENLEQPAEVEPPAETAQLALNNAEERLLDSRETMQKSQRQVGGQLEKRTWKQETDVSHGLLCRGPRQSRSLSPQRSAPQKKSGHLALKEPDQETQSNSGARDITQYGRGRLNYPLPDLSKVEPRVRFPKDPQSYHPPQGKTYPASKKEDRKLVIFKSPAEIVREVLLSSTEGSPQKCPMPAVSVIPEELKSPRQATELVHQLQEDYHKLLTKYAEAENTIDRLRLSAKVRLYSDPPKPSQAAPELGRVPEGSKVVTFSIPQIRSAEVTGRSSQASMSGEGFPRQQVQHLSLSNSTVIDSSEADRPISSKTPFLGDHLTRLLATQASKFQTQMEFLEDLIRSDRLEAVDQLKGFARLKEAQETLEHAYLRARNKYQQLNPNGNMESLGEFDPSRAVEGNIFHLGLRLEGLKERMEQPARNQWIRPESPPRGVPSHPSFPGQLSEEQIGTPTPSLHAPVPASCVPYPEASPPQKNITRIQLERDLSSISDGAGEEEEDEQEEDGDFLALPQPCKRQEEEEEDLDHLLDQCSSFRSLPEVLSHKHNAEEPGSGATAAAGTKSSSLQKSSGANKASPASKELQEKNFRKVQQPGHQSRRLSSIQTEAALREPVEVNSPSVAVPKTFSRRQQAEFSPRSSMASVRESLASEPAAPHLPRKTNTTLCEDLRIVSPETDSGFVGSETSRASPLAQLPKHQLAKTRSFSTPRPSSTTDGPPCSPSSKKATAAAKQLGSNKLPGQVKPEGGRSRHTLAMRNPLQKTSSCRWTNEMEAEDNENFHPDSETETETHGGTSLDGSPPPRARDSPSSSPVSSNLAQARHRNFLHTRLERDEAIEALQYEVSRLRQSLEESLHRQSSSPHPSRTQDMVHLYPSIPLAGTSRKNGMESDGSFLATEPKGRSQKPPLAQQRSELDFNPSESDDATSKLQNVRCSPASRTRPSKPPTVQGPYTGTRYPISTLESQEPKRLETSSVDPQNAQLQLGEDSEAPSQGKETKGSPRDGSRPSRQRLIEGWVCPSCKDSANPRSKDITGAGDHKEIAPEGISGPQPKFSHQQQPKEGGFWYFAVPSAATSMNYIPAVPLAQCPLSSIIFSPPPVTTSICSSVALPAYDSSRRQATEWKTSRQRLRDRPTCSGAFPSASLEDLNWTLNRAVEAAKDMKFTTEQMNQSLRWALRKARSPRTSRLF